MRFNYKLYVGLSVFLLQIGLPSYSLSDGGSCARYRINVVLKNGHNLTGFIQISDHDPNIKDWKEDRIFERIKQYAKYKDNKMATYKQIQTINYPEGYKDYQYKYSVVSDKDITLIDCNQISSITKLDVMPCEFAKFTNTDSKVKLDPYKIHFTAQVIEGLSQEEINLLQQKPYHEVSFTSPESNDTDYCLNYNKSINEETLKEMCLSSEFYIKERKDISSEGFEKLQKQYYSKKVKELREKNIIVLHFYGGN